MAKRKLRIRELRFVVLENDVKVDGYLKSKYRVHVGRVLNPKDDNVILACSLDGKIRWIYFFNVFALDKLSFCPDCILNIMHELDEADYLSVRQFVAPLSNRGVNS